MLNEISFSKTGLKLLIDDTLFVFPELKNDENLCVKLFRRLDQPCSLTESNESVVIDFADGERFVFPKKEQGIGNDQI